MNLPNPFLSKNYLPKVLSNNTHVVQYADDIAIWVNTTLRKHTKKSVVSYVHKLYQSEMNKLTAYMKETVLNYHERRRV